MIYFILETLSVPHKWNSPLKSYFWNWKKTFVNLYFKSYTDVNHLLRDLIEMKYWTYRECSLCWESERNIDKHLTIAGDTEESPGNIAASWPINKCGILKKNCLSFRYLKLNLILNASEINKFVNQIKEIHKEAFFYTSLY